MIRDKLKNLDIRITELTDYLQVSRPTMYKFIDYYDTQEFDLINKKVLRLFNYINDNELISKRNVINYILNNLVEIKPLGEKDDNTIINKIKKIIISNPDSQKSKFIKLVSSCDDFDEIISFLVDVHPYLNKRKLTNEQKNKLVKLHEIKEIIRKEVDE